MSKAPPAFQFYAADFLTATDEWSCAEVGLYIRLLLSQWIKGSIPKEENRIARVAACHVSEFKDLWPVVKCKFNEGEDGRLRNNRLEEVRVDQAEYREKKRLAGILSGKARRNKKGTPVQTREETEGGTNGEQKGEQNANKKGTLQSSTSSSSLSSFDFTYVKSAGADSSNNHFSEKVGGYFESIKTSCDIIQKKACGKFNPFAWVQQKVNNKGHPGAIEEIVRTVIPVWETIQKPWPYLDAALKRQNPNFNEADAIKIHEELKRLDAEQFQGLTKGVFGKLIE
jgi:uncharacterized protein YdaU (DUF1376 family)